MVFAQVNIIGILSLFSTSRGEPEVEITHDHITTHSYRKAMQDHYQDALALHQRSELELELHPGKKHYNQTTSMSPTQQNPLESRENIQLLF